jgi:cytochrome bd-type quinol oxidase subunit 1
MMSRFAEMLHEQRWDDHRYYHHSLVNQSLHLVSATTFVVAYMLVFTDPALASLLGWFVAMVSRQAGTSSSSPKAMTRSTRRPTSTRKTSRSAIISRANGCS